MSTSPDTEQVEVTPELLADLEAEASTGPWRANGAFDGYRGHAAPNVVLALVRRIRELESAEQPMEMALCEQDGVTLRRDQPYIFRALPSCEKCAALAAVYE